MLVFYEGNKQIPKRDFMKYYSKLTVTGDIILFLLQIYYKKKQKTINILIHLISVQKNINTFPIDLEDRTKGSRKATPKVAEAHLKSSKNQNSREHAHYKGYKKLCRK